MRTVIIIDDHPVYRFGLKGIIRSAAEYSVIGEAGTAEEGIRLVKDLTPDIVVVDLTLPDLSGISVIRHLSVITKSRLMVLSAQGKARNVINCLQAGALGYVVKESGSQTIIDCLDTVSEGRQYLDPAVSLTVGDGDCDNLCDRYILLTDREREVMREIVKNRSTCLIAQNLCISENTVKTHRSHIYEKLRVKNKVELIKYAGRIGLIEEN